MENKSIKKPEIVVFAGPNGSGKSTITNLLRPPMLPYINADEIQRVLDCDNMEAAKIAENRREECLEKCKGFCFETVLSTDRNLKLLKRAKDAGFFIRCYYVLTADPQINVARVASRVSAGGHDVPTDKIISRYHKALSLVHELIVPVRIVAHAVAARVEPAGDVHDHRTAMPRKVSLHKLIEHDGARYNAAVHRRVLVGHRKIVVEPVDDRSRGCSGAWRRARRWRFRAR